MTEVSRPYSSFAAAYSAGSERRFSESMAEFALSRVGACDSVADVACGIGAACEYFAERGLRTSGFDASSDMLHRARAAARRRGLRIDYREQDMRELHLEEPVDLVTCMYDSLNFMMSAEDLAAAFRAARGCLKPGGHYVFDMYTVRGLAEEWGSRDQVHTVHPEHVVLTRTAWDADNFTNTKTLMGFERDGTVWRRWEERHAIRAYPPDEIEAALHRAGLTVRDMYDGDRREAAPTDDSTRLIAVAQAR